MSIIVFDRETNKEILVEGIDDPLKALLMVAKDKDLNHLKVYPSKIGAMASLGDFGVILYHSDGTHSDMVGVYF